jgi:hypothetical protein
MHCTIGVHGETWQTAADVELGWAHVTLGLPPG